jgi:phage shock protein E
MTRLLALVLATLLSSLTAYADQVYKPVDGQVIIDVRTPAEWKEEGYIEGALLIPYDQIKQKIGELIKDKNTKIALYCRSGRRSGLALDSLKELGYRNVENLGGFADAQTRLHAATANCTGKADTPC